MVGALETMIMTRIIGGRNGGCKDSGGVVVFLEATLLARLVAIIFGLQLRLAINHTRLGRPGGGEQDRVPLGGL